VALGLVLLYAAVTLGTWLFFRIRTARLATAQPV
jgi:hypothetical protein